MTHANPQPLSSRAPTRHRFSNRDARISLSALLVAYMALAVGYQKIVPLFEAPDEQSHIHYVAFVALEHRLPRYDARPDVPGEGMQPPLYYVMLAPLFAAAHLGDAQLLGDLTSASNWIYDGEKRFDPPAGARLRPARPPGGVRVFATTPNLLPLRVLRWGSLGFGLFALVATVAGARRATRSSTFALLAGALMGLSPQFLFASSYVSNDIASASVGAGALWLFAAALGKRVGRSHYIELALLVALGAMIKNATLPVLGATAVALVALDERALRSKAVDAAWSAVTAFVLLAPLALSNVERFGDPTGLGALWSSAAGLARPQAFGGVAHYLTHMYWVTTWTSSWAVFGWLNLFAPAPVYSAWFALTAIGIVGFTLKIKNRSAGHPPRVRAWRLYLTASVLATLAAHLWLNTRLVQPQGRHLLAAAPHFACLLAAGLSRLTSGDQWRPNWPLAWAVGASFFGISLYCLLYVISPAYG